MVEKNENEKTGHRKRLREKYLNSGIAAFYHDYEKLEFLLTFVFAQKDVKPMAKGLIAKFGTLENVLKSPVRDLVSVDGIGENTAIFLKYLGDFHMEIFREKIVESKVSITSNRDVVTYLRNEIGFQDRENFCVLFLNSANQIIDTPDLRIGSIFQGTIDRSAIYAREIVKLVTEQERIINEDLEKKLKLKFENEGKITEISAKNIIERAYRNKAKSVIFAHNHPSSNVKPSKSDIEITRNLKEALYQVEIRLLDHIIVGKESHFSFLEEGLIE